MWNPLLLNNKKNKNNLLLAELALCGKSEYPGAL